MGLASPARRRAMTLIEVLVAGALAMGMALMLYGSLAGSAQRFRTGEAGLEANLQAQRILQYLRKDLATPAVGGPCSAPDEVLAATGFASGLDMALAPRLVSHRFEYYQNSRGPVGEPTDHLAAPKRIRVPEPSDCPVRWDLDSARWLEKPRSDEATEKLRAAPHVVEVVGDQSQPPKAVVVGPAYWVFDKAAGMLRRYTLAEGMVEFGAGRLLDFLVSTEIERSYDDIRTPRGDFVQVREHKQYLTVGLVFDREEEREPLVVSTRLCFPGWAY